MPIGILHAHVHGEEDQIVAEGVPERFRPQRVAKQCFEVGEPDEMPGSGRVARVGRERHRRDQRVDREQGVDRDRRSEKQQQKARAFSAWHLGDDLGDRFGHIGNSAPCFPSPRFVGERAGVRRGVARQKALRKTPNPLRAIARRGGWRHFAGLYHLSRPSCSCFAAASGVSLAFTTCADTFQSSFSRFGVPRDRT